MKIQALKFESFDYNVSPQKTVLEIKTADDLKNLKKDGRPAVYVISSEDLNKFRQFKESIIDRGSKNRGKELSFYLLGKGTGNILIINGNYSPESDQVKRSINDLISKISAKKESNIYIVGAEARAFQKYWGRVNSRVGEKAGIIPAPESDLLKNGFDETGYQLMNELKLMDRCAVPETLKEKYVGDSDQVQFVRILIMLAGRNDVPVLIIGDTGTGKEIVARQIHEYSERNKNDFIPVNCGAIPRELFESELFGHEKGAFTGASKKIGLWECAGSGTLFLDEIGDLHPYHQVKIIRALSEKKIRRVGGLEDIPVNARIVTATNRDLSHMVQKGQFREDLYYRLRGFFIPTPALRNHRQDIALLAQFFWQKITGDSTRKLPQDILDALQLRNWPGNARELKMVLNHLYALFGTDNPKLKHLEFVFNYEGRTVSIENGPVSEKEIALHRAECLRHLKRVDDIVRTARFAIVPVVEGIEKRQDVLVSLRKTLIFRLSELDMLSRQHLLFHSPSTFSSVTRFKEKLSCLIEIITEIKEARKYWSEILSAEFERVLSAIFSEVEKISSSV